MPTNLLQDGQVLRDTWEVERFLGEGAFAEVYRVRHRFLGRQAMKVFKAAGLTLAEIARLLEEALLLSRLGHPHIIRVFEANTIKLEHGLCGFFTMEYVTGGSLEQFWRSQGGRLPVATTVEIVRQVCSGLAVAHSALPPIIHRDVKPQNILIEQTPEGYHARLSDFGLARRANPLTLLASARGTLAFKAPEVLRNPQADSRAGDVWALGCTLYLLLTNEFPYPEALDSRSLHQLGRTPLVPPSQLNVRVDADLDAVVARALAVDLQRRYPDALALLENLNRWQSRTAQAASLPTERGTVAAATEQSQPEQEARRLLAEALTLARQTVQLSRAIALVELACRHYPALRAECEDYLHLWRRGISM